MSTEQVSAGFEYQLSPQMVFSGRYIRNNLIRTIEDLGVLVDGDEDYYYVNPGEGIAETMLVSGATDPFPTPKPKRDRAAGDRAQHVASGPGNPA